MFPNDVNYTIFATNQDCASTITDIVDGVRFYMIIRCLLNTSSNNFFRTRLAIRLHTISSGQDKVFGLTCIIIGTASLVFTWMHILNVGRIQMVPIVVGTDNKC